MTTNSESGIVLVTTVIDDREKAETIARGLVDARAAACVQVGGPVARVYLPTAASAAGRGRAAPG